MKRTVRRGFVCVAIAWAVVLPLTALAASRAHVSAPVSACAIAVYLVGSVICHQLPARSFHLWSAQLPVCARCTGIYLGAAIAAAIIHLRDGGPRRPPWAGPLAGLSRTAPAGHGRGGPSTAASAAVRAAQGVSPAKIAVLFALLPSLATLVYEWTTGDPPSNPIRFAAGLPLGAVVSRLVLRVH